MVITISLSALTPFYRQQLGEVLGSIGIALPTVVGKGGSKSVTIKFQASEDVRKNNPRSRSLTPTSRHNARDRSTSRIMSSTAPRVRRGRSPVPSGRASPVDILNESLISEIVQIFPQMDSFKFTHNWRPRKFVLSKLVAVIDAFFDANATSTNGEVFSPSTLIRYYQDKLGLRSLVEFTILDLLSNAIFYRKQCMESDILLRFIESFYDGLDWNFFCVARKILKPVLGIANRGTGTLSLTDCEDMCGKMITADGHNLHIESVLKILKTEGEEINANYFLYICLWVFHHQRGAVIDVGRHSVGDLSSMSFVSAAANPAITSAADVSVIDSYIDSILQLKKETRTIRASVAAGVPKKNIVRDSVQMEEVVNRILSDCCEKVVGRGNGDALTVADQLMTAVMNADEGLWALVHQTCSKNKYSLSVENFAKCIDSRDELLAAIGDEKGSEVVENSLYRFCMSIAQVPLVSEVAASSAVPSTTAAVRDA